MLKIKLSEIQIGDHFSESSHYTLLKTEGNNYIFKHLESKNEVSLGKTYVENLLSSGDQYEKEVKVGKEDKFWTLKQIAEGIKKGEFTTANAPRPGDIRVSGIRSIWDSIHSSKCFVLAFYKQSKELTANQLAELKNKQIEEAVAAIEKAQKNKSGVANKAKEVITAIQENPIIPIIKGDLRILRGFKIQFESVTGHYDCIDMDIVSVKERDNIRPININTLQWLVIDGIKYIVE